MMITGSLQKFKIFFSFLARVGSQDADSGVLETIDASLENIMEPEKKALKKKKFTVFTGKGPYQRNMI